MHLTLDKTYVILWQGKPAGDALLPRTIQGGAMNEEIARNRWSVVLHDASDDIVELRWLPGQMTDAAFKATLALLALEAERLRPSAILIDATQFQHQLGPGVMEWRNDCIVPRYGSAGVQKFAFHV